MIYEYNGHMIAIHSMDKGQTYRASTTMEDVPPVVAETQEAALEAIKEMMG